MDERSPVIKQSGDENREFVAEVNVRPTHGPVPAVPVESAANILQLIVLNLIPDPVFMVNVFSGCTTFVYCRVSPS